MTAISSEPHCELDSHADTCVFGKYCRVLQTYSHTLDVTGFHSSMNTLKMFILRVFVSRMIV